jgi:putative DNA primase/helicase
VLINTVMGILGGYSRRLPASSLMKQRNSDAASGDIAGLKGARFVATSEPERGQQLNGKQVGMAVYTNG